MFLSYTVDSISISYSRCNTVDRPSAAVILLSSSQYCSLTDVLLFSKTVLPWCTPCSRSYTSTERPQPVTLVQPSNRLDCDKVPYSDVFLSLEQARIISETVDDPFVRAISATLPLSQLRVIPVPEYNCWCSDLPLLASLLVATHNSVSKIPSSSP